ncbi:DUF2147 domain-containing protein [Sphingomonas sp. KRR8]|uniref:DUF2147 domain-containing protein n=1 Tax=Sphingomonas sp. KRR8 TaxID=2942996 RepID=UPI0020221E4B|nr:DUF2147 domain-containing protein [Sphingomonas sp. KRR8]URD61559.1 DUF2147 domain-containing protein [Sphingomonas sp. KRR8]
MLSILMAAAIAAAPPPSDNVLGLWKTETRNGVVEISRCGASVCGRLVTSDGLKANPNLKDVNNSDASLRGRPLKGLLILGGFKSEGLVWNGGKIYNADDGKTYTARLTPAGNQLKVRGCIFVPLCKTQTWTRIR